MWLESVSAFWEQAELKKPTPPNALGPFYKKRAPDTRMLRTKGDAGMPLAVSGRIVDTRGEAVPDATVEIWHTDHGGHYDLAGYRFRAKVPVDGKGGYQFDTIMPGHYPDRVCQHVHYLVTAPGHKPLITQLYFATDPVFEGDPDKNFSKDPLIREPRARQARHDRRRSESHVRGRGFRAVPRAPMMSRTLFVLVALCCCRCRHWRRHASSP